MFVSSLHFDGACAHVTESAWFAPPGFWLLSEPQVADWTARYVANCETQNLGELGAAWRLGGLAVKIQWLRSALLSKSLKALRIEIRREMKMRPIMSVRTCTSRPERRRSARKAIFTRNAGAVRSLDGAFPRLRHRSSAQHGRARCRGARPYRRNELRAARASLRVCEEARGQPAPPIGAPWRLERTGTSSSGGGASGCTVT
jgi:hypothetical protein